MPGPAISGAFSQIQKSKNQQVGNTSQPEYPGINQAQFLQPQPPPQEDLGPQGQPLPPGAEAWKPDGKPYFGEGLQGKLSEYWYSFTKDIPFLSTAQEMKDLAAQSRTYREQFGPVAINPYSQQMGENVAEAFKGRGELTPEEQKTLDTLTQKQRSGGIGLSTDEIRQFRELSARGDQSVLSGLRRFVNTGVQAGTDVLNQAAIWTEQLIGAGRGAAEELQTQGQESNLPSLVGEYQPEQAAQRASQWRQDYTDRVKSGEINPKLQPPSISWQMAKDNLKQYLVNTPLGIAYNVIRTTLSPTGGDWTKVKNAWDKGWNSGRMLYTQIYDPMTRYEYERRLDEGENPELLALELQNPYAEAIGQIVLDPLNFIGDFAKAAKYADTLADSADAIRATGTLAKADYDNVIQAFRSVNTQEGAARVLDDFTSLHMQTVLEREAQRVQKYGLFQLTSTSQKNRLIRDMSDFLGVTTTQMLKEGKNADDIAEIYKFGLMSVSKDPDEVAAGVRGLMNAGVPRYFFSDQGIDTMTSLRKIMSETPEQLASKEEALAKAQEYLQNAISKRDDIARTIENLPEKQVPIGLRRNVTKAEEAVAKAERRISTLEEIAKGKPTTAGRQAEMTRAQATLKEAQIRLENAQKAVSEVQTGVNVPTSWKNRLESAENSILKAQEILSDKEKLLEATVNPEKILNALKADNPIEKLDNIINAASSETFPSVSEMQKAYDTVQTGKQVNEKTQRLAELYNKVPEQVKYFNKWVKPIEATKNKINSFLGFFYFTANPGTAIRNMTSNSTFILVDEGVGAFFDNGVYLGMKQVDDELVKFYGYIPEAAGSETFSQMLGNKAGLMQRGEASSSKRVILKRSKDAFGRIMETALPFDEGLRAAGMTDNQFKLFKELVKKDGDISSAIQSFNRMTGVGGMDAWRTLDFLPPKYVQGLKENGSVWDELLDLASEPNASIDDVDKFFDTKIKAYADNARKAAADEIAAGQKYFSSDSFANMKDAVESGYIDRGDYARLAAYEEAANQATELMLKETEKALKAAGDTVPTEVALAQNRLSQHYFTGGQTVGKNTKDLIDRTWEFTYAIRDRKEFSEIPHAWNALGLTGDMPTSPKEFLNVMWEQVKDKRGKMWEQFFRDTYNGSQDVVDAMKLGGINVEDLESSLVRARALSEQAQEYKTAFYNGKQLVGAEVVSTAEVGTTQNANDVRKLANRYGVASDRGDTHILNIINKYDEQAEAFSKLEDVPFETAKNAFSARAKPKDTPLVTPYVLGSPVTEPRKMLENSKGFTEAMEFTRNAIKERWGQTISGGNLTQVLQEYGAKYGNRIAESKLIALKNAEYWRDFTLLGYGTDKTYFDLASQYLTPYSFWYSGTYRNMVQRVVTDPEVLAAYAKYKHANEQLHADAPDWYKQNVQVDNLFGMELEHPLFFNLEATLWPLNALTGPDFNDKYKRVDAWTSTLDDMGKFGPSIWSPIQIATAISFAMKGDQDTALRWAGRLLPQSPGIKALSSLLFGKPIEIDPNVLAFGGSKPFDIYGAMDAYESGRVARALGDVQQQEIDAVMESGLTSEQKQNAISEIEAKYLDIARTRTGPEWEEAYRLATNLRGPGQISSPLLGVGFKSRTDVDIQLDEMYSQMNQIMTMRDGMSKEDYQQAWGDLRDKYPYMDTVLLARKGGDLRDSAYAYNVFGRVPPGKTDDIARELKIQDLLNKFYDNKGSFDGWSEQDKSRFMDAAIDIGATFSIPPDAVKEEWQQAKNSSNEMYQYLESVYGDDIQEKLTTYYGLRDDNYQAGRLYMEAHPEISDYLNDKSQIVVDNPLLYKYYGSLQTIESYYDSALRSELQNLHGQDIFEIASEYSSIPKVDEAARKQWRKDNKDKYDRLKSFWDDYYSEGTQRNVNEAILRMYDSLPSAPEPLLRGEPQSAVQEAIANAVQPQGPSSAELVSQMPAALTELVDLYWQGEELPDVAIQELEYIGSRYGLSANDVLLRVSGQGAPTQSAPTQPTGGTQPRQSSFDYQSFNQQVSERQNNMGPKAFSNWVKSLRDNKGFMDMLRANGLILFEDGSVGVR